jgi:mannose/fructose/N-acetylgalactosamine-specific phosphotransferase system component IID
MFKRFLMGYLVVGAVVATWVNIEGAMTGSDSAFSMSTTLSQTVVHFLVLFCMPALSWPVIVFGAVYTVLDAVFNTVLSHLHF